MEVIHLYLLIKIGGNYTFFITSSWQSLSSAAELDKVEITTLGQICGLSNPFFNSQIGNGEYENVCYLFSICPPPPRSISATLCLGRLAPMDYIRWAPLFYFLGFTGFGQ